MTWIKKNCSTIILIFIFIIGLSLLLYPTLSDYWNSFHQSQAIASYVEEVKKIDGDEYQEIWKKAREYNEKLPAKEQRWVLSDEEVEEYNSHNTDRLDVEGMKKLLLKLDLFN